MNVVRSRPVSVYTMLIVGLAPLVAAGTSSLRFHTVGDTVHVVGLFFGTAWAAIWLSRVFWLRMETTPTRVQITWVGFGRGGVDLTQLRRLESGGAGTALWVELSDAHGQSVKLNLTQGWTRQDQWAPLILKAAQVTNAEFFGNALEYLENPPWFIRPKGKA